MNRTPFRDKYFTQYCTTREEAKDKRERGGENENDSNNNIESNKCAHFYATGCSDCVILSGSTSSSSDDDDVSLLVLSLT